MFTQTWTSLLSGRRKLLVILLIGLVHGGIYVFLMPPWQHYDEPGNFEYAWVIANQGLMMQPELYDAAVRREIAASMLEHNFFVNVSSLPNLLSEKPWIGISQTRDLPLYYVLMALPLRLLPGADITQQLYALRLVSLSMYLATLLLAHLITRELFPAQPRLHWAVPTFIALNPAFTDLMTAVNNDIGATLFFSLFLLAGAQIFMRGLTVKRFVLLAAATAACALTKFTVLAAVPMAALLLVLLAFRAPRPWSFAGPGILALFLILFPIIFLDWKDAAYWYRNVPTAQQTTPTRQAHPANPTGGHALHISRAPSDEATLALFQPLPQEHVEQLRGRNFTLGAWIWASEPIEIRLFSLRVDGQTLSQTFRVQTEPAFFTLQGKVPQEARHVQVVLNPNLSQSDLPFSVYMDHVVLVRGRYAENEPPVFENGAGMSGVWGGKEFTNLLRNPSAEKTWITIKPAWLARFGSQTAVPIYAVPTVQDVRFSGGYYHLTVRNLFRSFWATFGWNHISLSPGWYDALLWVSAAGLAGALWWTIRQIRRLTLSEKLALVWLMTSAGLVWLATLMRTSLPIGFSSVLIPAARYAFPAIIPTMLAFVIGWHTLADAHPRLKHAILIPWVFICALDVAAILTISSYYSS